MESVLIKDGTILIITNIYQVLMIFTCIRNSFNPTNSIMKHYEGVNITLILQMRDLVWGLIQLVRDKTQSHTHKI